jgi:leucyl/phenylalanyl-tRNA--protein transferase
MSITPEILLRAYSMGIFPMAESRDSTDIHWVEPRLRGIFPIDGFHISRSLRAQILHGDYSVTVDHDFAGVVAACADRAATWINGEITDLYQQLHEMGFAHSVEVWRSDALIGGVYGVHLGTAFFGESMFSRATGGSKLALAYLIHRLRAGGFALFDTQYLTPHLASLGAMEIPKSVYQTRLADALTTQASFLPQDYWPVPDSVAAGSPAGSGAGATSGKAKSGTSQRITQTS